MLLSSSTSHFHLQELGSISARVLINQSVRACDLGKLLLLGVLFHHFHLLLQELVVPCVHFVRDIGNADSYKDAVCPLFRLLSFTLFNSPDVQQSLYAL